MVRLYEYVLPPLEHMDADTHFAYVVKLRNTGQLPYPPIDAKDEQGIERQSGSPPLYYATAALFSVGHRAPRVDLIRNPWHAELVSPYSNDNRYLYLMNPNQHILTSSEADYINSVHWARLASHLFGIVALFAIYGLSLQLWQNKHYALLSVAFVAFNPKFLQISAAVTNDNAAIAFSAFILWAACGLVTKWRQTPWLIFGGLVMGLGALSKANALTLWVVIAFAVAYGWFCDAKGKPLVQHFWAGFRSTVILIGVALMLSGWWFLRTWLLFDDPLGFEPHRTSAWGTSLGPKFFEFVPDVPAKFSEMWGDLGTGTVEIPDWSFYLVGSWLFVALLAWRKLPLRIELLLLVISMGLGIVGLWRWSSVSHIVPGRLMMPYFVAIAPMIGWSIGQYQRLVAALFVASLAVGALIVIVISVYHAFAAPILLDEIPDDLQGQPLHFTLPDGDTIRFLGYRVDDERIERAGDVRTFSLCWQGISASDRETLAVNLAFSIEIVPLDLSEPLGKRQSVMGLGKYTLWENGAVFCDTFKLQLDETPAIGQVYRLVLSMFDYRSGIPLSADGLQIGSIWRAAPQLAPEKRPASPFSFGEIVLIDPRLSWDDESLRLQLLWSPEENIFQSRNAVMFLYNPITDENVKQLDVALGDSTYPSWAWRTGECILQEIEMPIADVPSGIYTVLLGVYDPVTLLRFPARIAGNLYPNGLIPVGQITTGDQRQNPSPTEPLTCGENG